MPSGLIWKEWREQRTVMLAGIGIAVALPFFLIAGASTMGRGIDYADLAAVLPMFHAALIWPLFAAAAAAGTVANEKGEGSLDFLLSRPASRSSIWCVKMAVAAFAALAVIAATLAASLAFAHLAGPDAVARMVLPVPWGASRGSMSGAVLAAVFLLAFGTASFFSTLLQRSLTVTAASIAVSIALVSGMTLVLLRANAVPWLEPQFLAAEVALAGLLFLGASWWTFTRGGMLRGRSLRRNAAGTAVLTGAVLLGATLPLVQIAGRIDPDEAVFEDVTMTPDGTAIVAQVRDRRFHARQIWSIPLDRGGMLRLTGRLTLAPEVSPDGDWVSYLSVRGPLGLRGNRTSLRVVRTDGSGDREILSDVRQGGITHTGELQLGTAFSPDGERVAIHEGGQVLVVDLRTGATRSLELTDPLVAGGTDLLGWTGDEIVLYPLRTAGTATFRIVAMHVETGETRVVIAGDELALWPRAFARRPVVDGVLALVTYRREDEETGLYRARLIDLATGAATPLSEGGCGSRMDLTPEFVAFSNCDEPERRSTIRVRDRATGEEVVLGKLPDLPRSLAVSPRGDRVLVQTVPEPGPGPGVRGWSLARGGDPQEFPAGLLPIGWSGRDRVVLEDSRDGDTVRIAMSRPDGSDLRAIFP
ncbi:MAG: ABC transporter permease subunit [Acidobacteriota bacterium]|jgi:ABC-type transport system involved in multi-copper enzyme maturation permease subunit